MIPVVHSRADDHHRAPVGLGGIIGKLTGDSYGLFGLNAGDLLLPCRGIGNIVVEGRGTGAAKSPIDTVIGAQKVEHGRNTRLAVGEFDAPHRHIAQQYVAALIVFGEVLMQRPAKIRECHGCDIVALIDEAEGEIDLISRFAVLRLQIPPSGSLAFGRPAIPGRTLRHDEVAGLLFCRDGLPCRALGGRRAGQIALPDIAVGNPSITVLAQPHQHRHIRVATGIILEVRNLLVDEELLHDHMPHRHGKGGVGSLLRMDPQVGKLSDLGIVRRNRHDARAVVARLDEEMRVRRARLRHVGAPGDDIAGIVPVGGFRYVGLLAPCLRARRRQVAIPVVKRQQRAADQAEVTRA